MIDMRIHQYVLVLILIVSMASVQSCYYDVEEELYPSQFCDTTVTSSYSLKVAPLMDAHCTGCHGGSSPTDGINLENYAGVKAQADNGKLLCTISHAAGCSPMPDDSPKINACDIIQIERWINAGAQND